MRRPESGGFGSGRRRIALACSLLLIPLPLGSAAATPPDHFSGDQETDTNIAVDGSGQITVRTDVAWNKRPRSGPAPQCPGDDTVIHRPPSKQVPYATRVDVFDERGYCGQSTEIGPASLGDYLDVSRYRARHAHAGEAPSAWTLTDATRKRDRVRLEFHNTLAGKTESPPPTELGVRFPGKIVRAAGARVSGRYAVWELTEAPHTLVVEGDLVGASQRRARNGRRALGITAGVVVVAAGILTPVLVRRHRAGEDQEAV